MVQTKANDSSFFVFGIRASFTGLASKFQAARDPCAS